MFDKKKLKVWRFFSIFVVFALTIGLLAINPKVSLAATKPTITYFVQMDAKVAVSYDNFSKIAAYQLLMKKLNVNIQFIHPPMGGTAAQDQLNLMIASKKLPDIIYWNWVDNYPGGPVKALQDKVIIRLNEYVDKYAPNFKSYLSKHPDVKKMIVTDDGDLYCFPYLREDPEIQGTFYGPIVRKDWLSKLKISPPETVDEWYKMLKAFKANDLNGNGKNDERPFSISLGGATSPRRAFDYCSFLVGAWGIKTDFFVENNKIQYGPLKPQYTDFIKTLQKWWKEGLIDPDVLTMNRDIIRANIQNDLIGAFLGLIGGDLAFFVNLKKDLMGVKYPVLKKGQKPEFSHREPQFTKSGAAITTSCKNIQLAIKVLDWGWSKEGFMALNFGVLGKSYVIKDGRPVYTDEVMNNPQLDRPSALARYACASFGGPFIQAKENALQIGLGLPQQKEASENWRYASNKKLLPILSFTSDEAKKLADIMNVVNTYYDEMFVRLMTGKLNDVEQLRKGLKRMRIDEAIKIYQQAYNRYISRK